MDNISIINNVFLPFLENLRYQKINIIALDMEGKILFYSNHLLRNPHERETNWIGKNYTDLPDPSDLIVRELYKLGVKAVEKKSILYFTYITNNIDIKAVEFPIYNGHIVPYFNAATGEVIAVYAITTPSIPLGFEAIAFGNMKSIKPLDPRIHLSWRQHEVLFLLCYNVSQANIANILGLSRGTISKIIFEQIFPKIEEISPIYSVEDLVKVALDLGINTNFPPSLINPKVLEWE